MILIALASPFAAISISLTLYLVQKFYLRTSRQLQHLNLEAKSPPYTHFSELLTGLATVRAFGFQRARCRSSTARSWTARSGRSTRSSRCSAG